MRLAVRAIGVAAVLLAATAGWMRAYRVQLDPPLGGRLEVIVALELPDGARELGAVIQRVVDTGQRQALEAELAADRVLICAYWLFLAGSGWLLSRRPVRWAGPLGWLAVVLASGAVVADVNENRWLAAALDLPAGELTESFVTRLRCASQAKWGLFFLAVGLAAGPFLTRPSGWMRALGALFLLAMLAGLPSPLHRQAVAWGLGPLLLAVPAAAAVYLARPDELAH